MNLEVKINNDDSMPVRIVNGQPVISWVFEETKLITAEDFGGIKRESIVDQEFYEIRVGTSSSNLGTNSFFGDRLSTGVTYSQTRQYVYRKSNLSRGNFYYGQIRIEDTAGDSSDWVIFSFEFNSIPVATLPDISPESPTINDDLDLSYTFTDSDGDFESGTHIRWFRDGVRQRDFDNETIIPSRYLSYGDTWIADIQPSDGFEFGTRITTKPVSVLVTAPVADSVNILPSIPSENDILKADYDFQSDLTENNSRIRWFVNEELQVDFNNEIFVRLDLSEGDDVRFEVTPYDGTSYGSTVSSPTVTVALSDYIVKHIRIEGQLEPLNISAIRPVVTWQVKTPTNLEVEYFSIKIGRFHGGDDIYSETVNSRQSSFKIPSGIIAVGRDYYVSVAVSNDDNPENFTTTHFRSSGSCWEETVDNDIGWTVETVLILDQSAEFDEEKYQVIRIQDGKRFGEVRIYRNRLGFMSSVATLSEKLDLDGVIDVIVTGQKNDVKIYLNRKLVIDASGEMTQSSTSKRLEIGSTSGEPIDARYKNINYTTSGDYSPVPLSEYGQVSSYADMQFYEYAQFVGYRAQTLEGFIKDSRDYRIVGVNPQDERDGGKLYLISSNRFIRCPTVSTTFTPINRIKVSPSGQYTILAHARGSTIMRGYPIINYDYSLDMFGDDKAEPTSSGWELYQNVGIEIAEFDSKGFLIDTSYENIGKRHLEVIDDSDD